MAHSVLIAPNSTKGAFLSQDYDDYVNRPGDVVYGTGMLFKPRGVDIHVESRARDQARWAIRDHGDDAEEVLRAKLAKARVSEADRYRYKLTLREIARLRRNEPEKYGTGKPQGGLIGSFKGLFS